MKGIVLAGGAGTRLHPITRVISKQLLPVYDKPMIYYPVSVLMLAGIREILIISTPEDLPLFRRLLNDGSKWGVKFSYAVQDHPKGLADAFIVGREFVDREDVALVLGDNIFHGHSFELLLHQAVSGLNGATVFGYRVQDPERYGVAVLGEDGGLLDIVEKPDIAPTNIAITGLYLYDNQVVEIAAGLRPSRRGELEITDINRAYIAQDRADLLHLPTGMAWLDTGTHESLLEAAQYVQTLTHRQGIRIACIEEIAYRRGWISAEELIALAADLGNTSYGTYLSRVAAEG